MENDIKLGKFLSLVLRHSPETIGLKLDPNGWADVTELLSAINRSGRRIDKNTLDKLVADNNKKRYSYNAEKTKIRANQGHSISVDLELKPVAPPVVLYHGTVDRFCEEIKKDGLKRQNRTHVHLSDEKETAVNVGRRHGRPVVLAISAAAMHEAGYTFYLSENGVWLTDHVPVKYIKFG